MSLFVRSSLALAAVLLILTTSSPTPVYSHEEHVSPVKKHISDGLTKYWKEGKEHHLAVDHLGEVRSLLWKKYLEEIRGNRTRKKEHQEKKIHFRNKVMKYFSKVIGKPGKNGYPLYICLHGGGGAPARINDSQWRHMKIYYRRSVKRGVYVAPRGITNTWNLHFVSDSYPMYDRLIENMIAFENVDPNRVYFTGFSAGGDGVYQISPRLADRLAAANMSAGHPNNTNPKNLYNLPFSIQVGEGDRAYKRNTQAVKYGQKLKKLQSQHPKGYVHQLYVHYGRGHGFYDMHPRFVKQWVLAKPYDWLKNKNRKRIKVDTNAVTWLKKHTRNPLPTKIIWDLKTRANRSGVDGKKNTQLWATTHRGQQFYWLSVVGGKKGEIGREIQVEADPQTNTIRVVKSGGYLRVLLSSKTFDFSKPFTVKVDGLELSLKVKPSLKTMVQTLLDRGDPHYIFEGAITMTKDKDGWVFE